MGVYIDRQVFQDHALKTCDYTGGSRKLVLPLRQIRQLLLLLLEMTQFVFSLEPQDP